MIQKSPSPTRKPELEQHFLALRWWSSHVAFVGLSFFIREVYFYLIALL